MEHQYVVSDRAAPSEGPRLASGFRAQTEVPRCAACCCVNASARGSAAMLVLLAAACAVTGGLLLPLSRHQDQCIEVLYDDGQEDGTAANVEWCGSNCSATDPNNSRQRVRLGETGTVRMHVTQDMPGPVYLFYRLEEFYQTGRKYVQSRSDQQLAGIDVLLNSGSYSWSSSSNMNDPEVKAAFSSCEPLRLPNGASSQASCTWNSSDAAAIRAQRQSLNLSSSAKPSPEPKPCKIMWPCGLVAGSFFNDVFTSPSHNESWTETGIAWSSDTLGGRYANPTKATAGWDYAEEVAKGSSSFYYMLYQQYPHFPRLKEEGVENEHFIIWMRTAALPTFRNVYAKLKVDKLSAGETVEVRVASRFDVSAFDGRKSLVLCSGHVVGQVFGSTFLVLAACAGIAGVLLFVLDKREDRMLYIDGIRSNYNWNGRNAVKVD
eukprot:g2104.t1